MENQEQEGELVVSGGQFLVDKKAMERKINQELAKILDEELLPYKMYLKNSIKVLGLISGGYILTISGMIGYSLFKFKTINFDFWCIIFILSYIGFIVNTCALLFNARNHGFLIHPLYKWYRAKKIFRMIAQELHSKAMNGEIEVKNLDREFHYKLSNLENLKRRIEEEKRLQKEKYKLLAEYKQKLIEQAKGSKL